MNRSDTHRRISAICRSGHHQALFAVGYLTQDATSERLEELLVALQEFDELTAPKLPIVHTDRAQELLRERFM